jgi:hypothetical protein
MDAYINKNIENLDFFTTFNTFKSKNEITKITLKFFYKKIKEESFPPRPTIINYKTSDSEEYLLDQINKEITSQNTNSKHTIKTIILSYSI